MSMPTYSTTASRRSRSACGHPALRLSANGRRGEIVG
jgi:hypothetical protein